MAAQPTVAETIDYADLAIGYCANDNAKGALFGKRKTASLKALIIDEAKINLRQTSFL